jgi:hypothetical protein
MRPTVDPLRYDQRMEPLPPAQLRAIGLALYEAFPPRPPYDPDDITTWDADQLDELAVWDAAVNGYELTWDPPDPVCPGHATTAPGEFTTLADWGDDGPDVEYVP